MGEVIGRGDDGVGKSATLPARVDVELDIDNNCDGVTDDHVPSLETTGATRKPSGVPVFKAFPELAFEPMGNGLLSDEPEAVAARVANSITVAGETAELEG